MFRVLTLFLVFTFLSFGDSKFRDDDSKTRILERKNPNSHIKVFMPSIPYSYISKNTNSGLIRSFDNERGWEFDLAKSYKRVDELTHIFEIRKNLKFQDGSSFTVDNVIRNLENFREYPLLYTNIDKVSFTLEKIDNYKVKIKLLKKYEMFLNDLARIYFYTDEYLEKYKPKGSETGSANKTPGAYGMGPYILKSGYAIGEEQTSKIELEANPFYWNSQYPKIKRVTVFTQLKLQEALLDITEKEGNLDIMPIPFNKKINVLMSKYSKLVIKKSTNNFIIFFNLINGNPKLSNKDVRLALNDAINQENLVNIVYKKEGKISPFATSSNYKIVDKIAKKKEYKENSYTEEEKKNLLNGLVLNVFTQDRFIFLFKGIEYQLKKYGVKFEYHLTYSEKEIYNQLLKTKKNKNTKNWDLLMWGNDDWYYKNPWTVFFIYENDSVWSTIKNDDIMNSYIQKYFETKIGTKEYELVTSNILNRARNMGYTLRVPSHNKVIAVNKEVIFEPYVGAMIPLWKISLTKDHWSVRGNRDYPKNLLVPVKPQRD